MLYERSSVYRQWCVLGLCLAIWGLSGCGFGPGHDIGSGGLTSKSAVDTTPSLTVSPVTATITAGSVMALTANVSNLPGTIQWSTTAGSISGSGTTVNFTAPGQAGTYTVTASGGSLSATATITVVKATAVTGESVSISPSTANVVAGSTLTLTAKPQGTANSNMIWTASAGTVTGTSTTGTYVAPTTAGTYTVTATTGDGNASASCTVTVTNPPPQPPSPNVVVTVSPGTATVTAGTQNPFTAIISGSSNTNVSWSASGGTILGTGLSATYTAPLTVGTYTITALSADPTGSVGTATITVVAPPPPPPPVPKVTVAVSPTLASLPATTSLILTAVVTGTANTALNWTATAGTIVGNGTTATYTAPATATTATVVATSVASPGASDTAVLTVTAPPAIQKVSIAMLPTQQTMSGGTTQSFTATVSGAIDTSVTWQTTGGTVAGTSNTVTYTAPLVHGTYTITAVSNADNTKSAFATVTVPSPTLSLTPTTWTMGEGGIQTFIATVTNSNATGVSWTATQGSIPATGNNVSFTAPNTATTVTLTATSLADPSVKATATVTVVSSKRPIISNVHSTTTPTSCTVTWDTDVGADSLLALSTGAGPYIPDWTTWPAVTTDQSSPGVTGHIATINGLVPGVGYSIYLRSRPFVGGALDTSPLDSGWYDGTSNCNNLGDGSVCNCTQQATTQNAPAYDFTMKLAGAVNVVQGYDTYIWLNYADISRPSGFLSNNMDVTIGGLPTANGETYSMYAPAGFVALDPHGNGLLKLPPSVVALDTALHIVTTAGTPLGTYTITFNNMHSEQFPGIVHNYSFTLNVVAPSFPAGFPASFPPIPGVGDINTVHTFLWGAVTRGNAFGYCTVGSTGASTGANFYDGIRAYQQIKAYDIANSMTGNPAQWDTCIANRENGYVGYINGSSPVGTIFAIYLASKGMEALALGGDTVAKNALFASSDNAQWKSMRPSMIDVGLGRELNFTTEANIAANNAGDPNQAAKIPIGITFLIGTVDQINYTNVSFAPFLAGTFADTLIHYYEDNGSTDKRIPMEIKALADNLWTKYWIPGGCSGATQQLKACFYYTAGQAQMGTDYATNGTAQNDADSNLLIAPMYAWLFRNTGNGTIPGSDGSQCLLGGGVPGQPCTYQQAGDSIFLSGAQQDDYFAVKEWNQAFRWGFDYLKWRNP